MNNPPSGAWQRVIKSKNNLKLHLCKVQILARVFCEFCCRMERRMIDGMNESTRRAVEEVKDGIHGRIFQEIVAEYLPINPYPEYKGKPYFSIKYTENEQEFIGYGTYKPEVLSEYLKEYFILSAKHGKWILKKELVPLPCDVCDPLNWNNYDETTHSEWEEFYHCSNCDYKTGTFERTNYCPNCGAQMENTKEDILDKEECYG